MGMTPEQYWDGESWLKKAYRKAYRLRIENEERIQDRNAWLQGIYIRDALQSISILVNGFVPKGAKPVDYPDKPLLEMQEEKKKAEAQKQREDNQMQLQMALFQAFAEQFNKKFDEKKESENATAT